MDIRRPLGPFKMNLDKRLLAEARAARLYLALVVGIGLLAGIAIILQAHFLSRAVALAFLQRQSLADLQPLLMGLAAVVVARAGLACIREAAASRAASRIKASLRERLLARLLELGPAHARGERTGELANTMVEGVEALEGYFSQYLPNLALALLVPATILLFVFPLDLVSGAVFLLTAPLIPLFMVLIGKAAEAMTRRQWESLSRMSAHFLDMLQGLPTLKLFGRSQEQANTIARVSDQFRVATMGVLRVAFLSALVLEMAATISTALVAVEVGLRLLYGTIPFEQAFFVLILAPEFYLPLRALGASFHSGMSGVAAARRIFDLLDGETGRRGDGEKTKQDGQDMPPYPVRPLSASPRPRVSASEPPSVRFEDVHFAYEGGRRPALRGVSFEIQAGTKTALVGPSGSGKSTAAHLLLGFLQPDRGEILVNGTPLGQLPSEQWRALVAWVPQNPYLFNTTVAENIRLARPEASHEEVLQAAHLARADQFIHRLPMGYDTPVGERGARLSGGQAQRIALARAFLKDAPLLILDEAASHLDPEQEALLQESLDRLQAGRTVLAIAHRLNTVYHADQIVVLEGGRVAEAGSHRQLLQRRGLYHRLATAYEGEGANILLPAGENNTPAAAAPFRVRVPRGDAQAEACGYIKGAAGHAQAEARGHGTRRSVPLSAIPPVDKAPMAARGPILPEPSPEGASSSLLETAASGATPATLWRLLRLASSLKGRMILAALLGFATVGSGIGLMATAAFLLASAALHPSVADLAVPIVGVRFFGISRGVFRYLERYLSHDVSFRLLARWRVWFYRAVEPLAPARLMGYRSGDLLARIVADVETLQHLYVGVLAPPVVAVLVLLFMGAFLSRFDPALSWTLAAFLLLSGVLVPLLSQRLGSGPGRRIARIRSDLNADLVDAVQGMADLVAFGAQQRQQDRVRQLNRRGVAAQKRMALVAGLHTGLGTLLANLGMVAVLLVAIPRVAGGRWEGVFLPALALAALASFEAVAPLAPAFQQLGRCLEAGRRLFEIVDAERAQGTRHKAQGDAETENPPLPLGEGRRTDLTPRPPSRRGKGENRPPLPMGEGWGEGCSSAPNSRLSTLNSQLSLSASLCPVPCALCLDVQNLHFRYAPSEPPALQGVSFQLPRGSRLAIVGPSGAGKSTLAHLLLRFWDYQEGRIFLEGRELRRYSEEEVRRRIALVSQHTHLFNATIRENLLIARPNATGEQLVWAARQAQLHPFVETLPDGYDTQIGEQGLRLSGGERQRLAIARALLADAPLLILDEPTAHLDGLTEREVGRSLFALMEGRTTLLITHRLRGLEEMEQILVLEAGRVVERGRHEQLMARDGLYRRLWDLQRQRLPTEVAWHLPKETGMA